MHAPQSGDKFAALMAQAALVAGCLLVLLPFVSALLWAVILSFATWPLHLRLRAFLRGRNTLSALLMTLGVAIAVLAPFVVVVAGLADGASELVDTVRVLLLDEGLPDPPAWVSRVPLIGAGMDAYWRGIAHDGAQLIEELRKLIPAARSALIAGGTHLGAGVLQLALSVLVVFFLFRDGDIAAARLQKVGALIAGVRARRLIAVAGSTVIGVVYGVLGTALAQGVLAGIGFALAGVPGAVLLGLATFFLSIVPAGPPLVWIPAALWLFSQGATGWAVFMLLWGALVISLVDNFVKPMIISRGSKLPFVLVFLGVLGGVVAFGFIGVFLGPTLLAVGYRVMIEWVEADAPSAPREGA